MISTPVPQLLAPPSLHVTPRPHRGRHADFSGVAIPRDAGTLVPGHREDALRWVGTLEDSIYGRRNGRKMLSGILLSTSRIWVFVSIYYTSMIASCY